MRLQTWHAQKQQQSQQQLLCSIVTSSSRRSQFVTGTNYTLGDNGIRYIQIHSGDIYTYKSTSCMHGGYQSHIVFKNLFTIPCLPSSIGWLLTGLDILKTTVSTRKQKTARVSSPLQWGIFILLMWFFFLLIISYIRNHEKYAHRRTASPTWNHSHPLCPWFTHTCKVCALPDSSTHTQTRPHLATTERSRRRRKIFSFPLQGAKKPQKQRK